MSPTLYFKLVSLLITLELAHGLHQKVARDKLPYGKSLKAILPGVEKITTPLIVVEDNSPFYATTNILDCECGTHSQKGDELERWAEEGVTNLSVYPWSVSLVAPGGRNAFCGGSLINDRYVLTAAACVDGSNSDGIEVLIGSWPYGHISSNDDGLNTTTLFRKSVVRVIMHPQYQDGHLDYNIALLRLNGPVPSFGQKGRVSPVCLPAPEDSYQGINASSLLWRFDEFGGTIVPRHRSEVEWTVLGQEECRELEYNDAWTKMPETMMCTTTKEPSSEHPYHFTYDCPGDAGGPLVVSVGRQKVQIGVDSWTACYSKPKGVGLFTRVSEFLPWIKSHISEDGRHCLS